jgi:hypothetical protein
MRSGVQLALATGVLVAPLHAQAIPASLSGKWRIVKILSTKNQQCWDQDRAKTLVGATLTYQQHTIVWQGGAYAVSEALSRTLSRRSFQDEYNVPLAELGIAAAEVEEIDLQHEDADITGATTEIPGDTILLAGPGRIVVSACGVFYSAVRAAGKPAAGR